MSEALRARVIIPNKRGLHARASAKIVEASARFQSDIHVVKDGTAVNGRSIMGLMMLAASIGSEVEITAEGPDAEDALKAILESGPIPAVHGVVRWRIVDLCQWIWEEFRISIAKQTLSRELRAMGYRKLTARPRHHAQAAGAIELFKKVSPPAWTKLRSKRASSPAP